MTVPP